MFWATIAAVVVASLNEVAVAWEAVFMLNHEQAESKGGRENERQTQEIELRCQSNLFFGAHHAVRLMGRSVGRS